MNYKNAGVDIDEGNKFVQMIKPIAKTTVTDGVLSGIGGFGALYEIGDYKKPVLVSGTDGVGTKLKIAFMLNKYDTIGIDLVAMCINDIIVSGAKPLFFLDYIGIGNLKSDICLKIIEGIAEGCRQSKCALIGGETAELPGMYLNGEFDLAGFAVGIVEKDKIINGSKIKPGDAIIGLKSSGIHSNGYSLVRKILFDKSHMDLDDYIPELNTTLGNALLKPTKLYLHAINSIKDIDIKGIAHITGGGFIDNIPRILSKSLSARINISSWDIPFIFTLLEEKGNIEMLEMFRTFNMGIGMIIVVSEEDAQKTLKGLKNAGEVPYIIGAIENGDGTVIISK